MDDPYWLSQLRKEKRIKEDQLLDDFKRGLLEPTEENGKAVYRARIGVMNRKPGVWMNNCDCSFCMGPNPFGELDAIEKLMKSG